jgi:hypothetical protein
VGPVRLNWLPAIPKVGPAPALPPSGASCQEGQGLAAGEEALAVEPVPQFAPVPVGYRALLLLRMLATKPGEIVSKAALLDAAWPDMAIEDGNLSVQISSLRKRLGPREGEGEWIVHVPRLGYRLAATEIAQFVEAPVAEDEPGPSIAVLPP